jgi:hypothetical protein
MGGLDGQFGGVSGSISLPVNGYAMDIMSSSRDHNTKHNVGLLPHGTNSLAHWIQKKLPRLRPGRAPILVKPDGKSHLLLKNGRKKGFFDYTAFKTHLASLSGEVAPGEQEASSMSEQEASSMEESGGKGKAPERSRSAPPSSRLLERRTPPPRPSGSTTGLRATPPLPQGDALTKGCNAVDALRSDRLAPESTIHMLGGAKAVATVGFDAIRNVKDPPARDCERDLITEMLLRELPGLDIDQTSSEDKDSINPTKQNIREAKLRYQERIVNLEKDLHAAQDAECSKEILAQKCRKEIIEDLCSEIDRCRGCIAILKASKKQSSRQNSENFWSENLHNRWREQHRDDVDISDLVREQRDLDEIEKKFPLLPQERCLLELEIAVEELLDVHRSGALTTEQFLQLVEAIARGWPGVKEDSQSPLPEKRANAAGCFRSLAQLASKGRLPREVLSSFKEYDAINRALLIRAQEQEIGGKFAALYEAEAELRKLDQSGKGKNREDDAPDLDQARLEARIKELKADLSHIDRNLTLENLTSMSHDMRRAWVARMRAAGRVLGMKYAELMEAERNLRAVGVDIRGVRVDEYYVLGLMKKDPKRRKQIALMLARIAFIEDAIARIDRRFKRSIVVSELTRGAIRKQISDSMEKARSEFLDDRERDNAELRPNKKLHKEKRHYPVHKEKRHWRGGEETRPVGSRADRQLAELRASGEDLLHYAITREDALEMQLPSVVEKAQGGEPHKRDIATIRNLAAANIMGPADVRLVNEMHGTVRKQIFDSKVGRTGLRSVTSRTTAQLAQEYLANVYRWATGGKDDTSLGHASKAVTDAMGARWRQVMKMEHSRKKEILRSAARINDLRNTILQSMACPNDVEDRARIKTAHAECVKEIGVIRKELLTEQQYQLIATMIRAAILAARPQTEIGDQAKVEAIDTYDASRYRPEIIAILESWGWSDDDVTLYRVLIDHFVFSRAENGDKAPGTVTARRLSRWLEYFQEGLEHIAAQEAASGGESRQASSASGDDPGQASWKERAKARASDAWNALVGYVSGKEIGAMDPALVDSFINGSIPALAKYGKISLRTNTMVSGGFPFAVISGLAIPIGAGAGPQTGAIVKRGPASMDVRLVRGWFLNGKPGLNGGGAVGAGAGDAGGALNGAWWETHGVTLQIPIKLDENGKEDFSLAQSYLRGLLTGALPSTEEWAKSLANLQLTEKSGKHGKGIGSGELIQGPAIDLPAIGKISAGVSESAALEHRRRRRLGIHRNPAETKRVTKWTHDTTVSGAISLGASLGFEHAAGSGVSELGGGAVKDKTLAAISAGAYLTDFTNTALYDLGADWDWDYITNIGPVRTAEEAFKKCRKDMADHLIPLLDHPTTLPNGDTVVFRDAVNDLLALMRYNDGFLLQFVPRPEVKEEVGRHLRRIAQIREQILPQLLPTRADGLFSNEKRRSIQDQRDNLLQEIADLEAKICAAKDPHNLETHRLANIFILPLAMQTDEMVVLNLLGLLKISHIGVRMHDTLVVTIPAPDLGQSQLQATEDALAAIDDDVVRRVERRRHRTPPPRWTVDPGSIAPNSSSSSPRTVVELDLSTPRTPTDDDYVLETPPPSPPSPPSSGSDVGLDDFTPPSSPIPSSPIRLLPITTRFRLLGPSPAVPAPERPPSSTSWSVDYGEETELVSSESSDDLG